MADLRSRSALGIDYANAAVSYGEDQDIPREVPMLSGDEIRAQGMGDFRRGVVGTDLSLQAGDLYGQSDDALNQGRTDEAARLEAEAQATDQRSAAYAREISSFRDVNNPLDVIDFFQGLGGSLLPTMAAPMAAGAAGAKAGAMIGTPFGPIGIGIGAFAGGAIGAAIPSYGMLESETASSQHADETLMQNTTAAERISERKSSAAKKLITEVALPTFVGGRLFGKAAKGLAEEAGSAVVKQTLRRTKTNLAEATLEGATEKFQGDIDQGSLRRLNPERDTSGDMDEDIDNFIAGFFGGGAVSTITTVPGYVAEKLRGDVSEKGPNAHPPGSDPEGPPGPGAGAFIPDSQTDELAANPAGPDDRGFIPDAQPNDTKPYDGMSIDDAIGKMNDPEFIAFTHFGTKQQGQDPGPQQSFTEEEKDAVYSAFLERTNTLDQEIQTLEKFDLTPKTLADKKKLRADLENAGANLLRDMSPGAIEQHKNAAKQTDIINEAEAQDEKVRSLNYFEVDGGLTEIRKRGIKADDIGSHLAMLVGKNVLTEEEAYAAQATPLGDAIINSGGSMQDLENHAKDMVRDLKKRIAKGEENLVKDQELLTEAINSGQEETLKLHLNEYVDIRGPANFTHEDLGKMSVSKAMSSGIKETEKLRAEQGIRIKRTDGKVHVVYTDDLKQEGKKRFGWDKNNLLEALSADPSFVGIVDGKDKLIEDTKPLQEKIGNLQKQIAKGGVSTPGLQKQLTAARAQLKAANTATYKALKMERPKNQKPVERQSTELESLGSETLDEQARSIRHEIAAAKLEMQNKKGMKIYEKALDKLYSARQEAGEQTAKKGKKQRVVDEETGKVSYEFDIIEDPEVAVQIDFALKHIGEGIKELRNVRRLEEKVAGAKGLQKGVLLKKLQAAQKKLDRGAFDESTFESLRTRTTPTRADLLAGNVATKGKPIAPLTPKQKAANRRANQKAVKKVLAAKKAKVSPRKPVVTETEVFHASNATFDAFDLEKVGSGEGSIDQGFGIYLTENQKEAGKISTKNLYKTKLSKKITDAMLLWDTPFNEQSAAIQKVLTGILSKEFIAKNPTGKDIYSTLRFARTPDKPYSAERERIASKAVSELLDSLGVSGIKYLNPDKTTNTYVVFNPKTLAAKKATPARPATSSSYVPGTVKLQGKSPYLAKDQAKSDKANKFIGQGSKQSSTNAYREAWGDRANTGEYTKDDTVFISVEGNRRGRLGLNIVEVKKAIAAGATIVADKAADRARNYNIGERQLAQVLKANGYTETNGVWTKGTESAPGPAQVEVQTEPSITQQVTELRATRDNLGKKLYSMEAKFAEKELGPEYNPEIGGQYQSHWLNLFFGPESENFKADIAKVPLKLRNDLQEIITLHKEFIASAKAARKQYVDNIESLRTAPEALANFVSALKSLPDNNLGSRGQIRSDLIKEMYDHMNDPKWAEAQIARKKAYIENKKLSNTNKLKGFIEYEIQLLEENNLQKLINEAAKEFYEKEYMWAFPAPVLKNISAAETKIGTSVSVPKITTPAGPATAERPSGVSVPMANMHKRSMASITRMNPEQLKTAAAATEKAIKTTLFTPFKQLKQIELAAIQARQKEEPVGSGELKLNRDQKIELLKANVTYETVWRVARAIFTREQLNAGSVVLAKNPPREGLLGTYDQIADVITLYPENMGTNGDAAWTIWHEFYHRGFRMAFNQGERSIKQYPSVTDPKRHITYTPEAAKLLAEASKNKIIDQMIYQMLDQRGLIGYLAIEEALMEIGTAIETGGWKKLESRYQITTTPALRGEAKQFWQRLMNFFRKQLGLPVKTTDAEVHNMLLVAKQHMFDKSKNQSISDNFILEEGADSIAADISRTRQAEYKGMRLAQLNRAKKVVEEKLVKYAKNPTVVKALNAQLGALQAEIKIKDAARIAAKETLQFSNQSQGGHRKGTFKTVAKARAGNKALNDAAIKGEKLVQKMLGDLISGPIDWFLHKNEGGAFGSYSKTTTGKFIRAAIDSLDPLSTLFHESMHALANELANLTEGKIQYAKIAKLAMSPHIQMQLRNLLKDSPAAVAQLKDPNESVAYMFQFHATGQIRIQPAASNTFKRWAEAFVQLIGYVTNTQAAQEIFESFLGGDLATIAGIQDTLRNMQHKRAAAAMQSMATPLGKAMSALFQTPIDRLKNTKNKHLVILANKYFAQVKAGGKLGAIQMTAQQHGHWLNGFEDILQKHKVTTKGVQRALRNLQSGKATSAFERDIRKLFEDLYKYASTGPGHVTALVEDENGRMVAKKIAYTPNFFPRVWSSQAILEQSDKLRKLLKSEGGLSDTQIDNFFDAVRRGEGIVDIGKATSSLTPAFSAANPRTFDFITDQNAHLFVEFQERDMHQIVSKYIRQVVHRREHGRAFGSDGKGVQKLLDAAEKSGATPEQMSMARKAIEAMDGTLGTESVSTPLRDAMVTGMTVVNFALLPLALFSSFVDPLGVLVRTGSLKHAATTFSAGVMQVYNDAKHIKGNGQKLAEYLGVIESETMLEVIGSTYNGMFMNQTLRKANAFFFKAIGLEQWTRGTRIGALNASLLYLRDTYSDPKATELQAKLNKQLNLQPGDIVPTKEGIKVTTLPEGARRSRVEQALFRMVDESILRPNSATRAIWMSDMRFVLFGHLKQFTYTFHNTINKQVAANFKEQRADGKSIASAALVGWPLLTYVPVMIAADMVRAVVSGNWEDDDEDPYGKIVNNSLQRSGIMGLGSFIMDAQRDYKYGNLPINTIVGPTIGKGYDLTRAALNNNVSFWDALASLIPGAALWKGWLK